MSLLTHDVQLGSYHSAKDFFLIPASKLVVTPPIERVEKVEVPGAAAPVYYARNTTGYPVYEAREGSWDFYLDTDALREAGKCPANPTARADVPLVLRLKDYIGHALAKQCQSPDTTKIILEDDPAFYYKGLVWLDDSSGATAQHSKITLKYLLYPFKLLVHPLNKDWEWDSFCFETDLAPQPFQSIPVPAKSSVLVELPPTDKPTRLSLVREGAGSDVLMASLVEWDSETGKEKVLLKTGLGSGETLSLPVQDGGSFYTGRALRFQNDFTSERRVRIDYTPGYL